MVDVGTLIDAPGERDVPVGSVFTPPMFAKLKEAMSAQGWPGIDAVEARWESDFSKRTIIAGFLKDKDIGAKRLASMPDRFNMQTRTKMLSLRQAHESGYCRVAQVKKGSGTSESSRDLVFM